MRKQYDDFTQMKIKEMCKSISDMTYTYLDPETHLPTKVPASHYEKILDQVKEQYMGEITSKQFLTIMYNQLTALKKEDDKYFQQALLCMDLGINPKDMRVDEQLALSMTYDFIYEKQKNMKKIIKLIPLMLILVLALTSCQKNAENSGKPKVYTSFYAMYDFTKTIGGDDIDLTNIVPTGTEPHDFEPTASDMAKLSEADIFIYNGVGMESWADKIIETLPQNVKVICTSEQIPTDGNDPHIWLSPQNAKLQMQAICNVLSEVDSKNAQNYINRLDSYLTQIDEVDTEYKNAELDGKTIFVTHGAYSYLCNDYGMKQVALEGVTGDSDPSPSQMAKVVDQIKSEGISCIFYDPLEGDKMAQAVANEADIQALPLYTFEGDSESRDYVTVMKANLEELKKGI